jgi:hypothetical protein
LTSLFKIDKLNARFQAIFVFTNLKIFFKFFEIKQWIDEEQKIIIKQIISIITSLMIEKWFRVIDFIKILVDCILIAQFKFHNESTLKYLSHAIFQINAFKKIFRQSWLIEHNIKKNHFNFSKFHVLSHYVNNIRKFEIVNEYDTFHDKAKYKYMFKKFYNQTNKRENFWLQLIEHNKKRINILTTENLKRHLKKKSESKNIETMHTRASKNSLDLKLLKISHHRQKNSSRDSIN